MSVKMMANSVSFSDRGGNKKTVHILIDNETEQAITNIREEGQKTLDNILENVSDYSSIVSDIDQLKNDSLTHKQGITELENETSELAESVGSTKEDVTQLAESIVEISGVEQYEETLVESEYKTGIVRKLSTALDYITSLWGFQHYDIEVNSGEKYLVSFCMVSSAYIPIAYNNDKTVIDNTLFDPTGIPADGSVDKTEITIPDGCTHLIVSTNRSKKDIEIYKLTKISGEGRLTVLEKRFDVLEKESASMYVSVANYGAKGDAKTDDTDAIQTAINENMNVYVPDGTYFVTKPIIIGEKKKVVLSKNATIRPTVNTTVFVMRSNTHLEGGTIYTYFLGSTFTKSAILIQNNSASDLQSVTIRDVSMTGERGCGVGIEIASDVSQTLYCSIDDVKMYGYNRGMFFNTVKASCAHYVLLTANYTSCVVYGSVSSSYFNVKGECGLRTANNNECINLIGNSSFNFVLSEMIDVGNSGHNEFAVSLSGDTTNNIIFGTIKTLLVNDNGQNNVFIDKIAQNNAKTGFVSNHIYNNILDNICYRYDVSVNLINCVASELVEGKTYSASSFLTDIGSITPKNAWKFEAVNANDWASVEIMINEINCVPYILTLEWYKKIGYEFGVGFNKISLYGRNADSDYELIAEKEYNREIALDSTIGNEFGIQSNKTKRYNDLKIVLSFIKSLSYPAYAVITALTLVGKCDDAHMAFVKSCGSKVYGNIEYADNSVGTVLTSENGSKYRLSVSNDGVLSAINVS